MTGSPLRARAWGALLALALLASISPLGPLALDSPTPAAAAAGAPSGGGPARPAIQVSATATMPPQRPGVVAPAAPEPAGQTATPTVTSTPAAGGQSPPILLVDQLPNPEQAASQSGPAPRSAGDGPATPTSSTLVAIDRPASGATTPQRFTIMGWAADPEGPGSGVDAVHVYLNGEAGTGAFLGAATYGEERLDVAAQLGQPRFGLSGYSLQIEVPPGPHTVYVHARRRVGSGSGAWSPPATVEVVAQPAVSVPEAGRVQLPSPGCPRAPDGSCINRVAMPAPTCPQIGPGGQCLQAAPGSQAPGWVGVPPPGQGTPVPSSICLQIDGAGNCISSTGAPNQVGTAFVLRAEASSGMASLSWNNLPGAVTYELLRCTAATGQSCTSVTVLNRTTYQLAQTPNTWYVVQARGGNGQVIGTSNVAGPT